MVNEPWLDDRVISFPGLVWHAHRTCDVIMGDALSRAAYDNIPVNGPYIIDRLAGGRGSYPLGQIVREMGLGKQRTGQLVDALVSRHYVSRTLNENDRRKLNLALTDQGRSAAAVLAYERGRLTDRVQRVVGAERVSVVRRALWELLEMRLRG